MILSCPSCSAKYQLADSKIKASGTKVRCPRCSHTFLVYQKGQEPEEIADHTELFIRRDDLLDKMKQKEEVASKLAAPTPAKSTVKITAEVESVEDSEFDSVFDQKTMVSKPVPEAQADGPSAKPKKSPPPPTIESPPENLDEDTMDSPPIKIKVKSKVIGDPARILEPKELISPDESSSVEEEIKPFGDATLFEIQKASRTRSSILKKFLPIAAGLLIFGGVAYWYFTGPSLSELDLTQPEKPVEEVAKKPMEKPTEVQRPSGWYNDDPQIYQETLSQIAALPKAEQEKPENRALIAEALILNGLLSGATDQVNRGLSFTPSLVINFPHQAFSYYGSAAYAMWFADKTTMNDMVENWPISGREDPEYSLLQIVYLSKTGKLEDAFEKASQLMKVQPGFQRANNYVYLMSLQSPPLADKYLDESTKKKLERFYDRHRDMLAKSLPELPKLHQEIDRLLGKSSAKKAPAAEPAPVKKIVEVPQNNKSEEVVKTETPAPRSKPKKASTRLPKASQELMAQNKISATQKKQAKTAYDQGNAQFSKGETDAALESYRQALKLDPDFADVYKRMGMIYMARKESERALRSFKIYLQLKPETDDKQMVEGWISSLQ
ncbi:MAG: hypothetical protein COV44_07220 [Deltaproteobacteria bacterium CG11_big_fil_rev_8_21_14_0_20_45_16]|nr:MAG: hypothetical protein COV44_07220 [Deltaproteobacteria bacterium CG11_big_fil_rev_8_21_14_0_20_45_16]